MDLNNLNIDPAGLTRGLELLFDYIPSSYIMATKHRKEGVHICGDMELQPFEMRKDDIILKIGTYRYEKDIKYNPRLVKSIEPIGISKDELKEQLAQLHGLGYI